MNMLYPGLYLWLRLATLAVIAAALLVPEALGSVAEPLALILILGAGVPHGATDHLIFRHLAPGGLGWRGHWKFYSRYLGGILVYGVVWWQFPALALGIFVLVSAYHFGQSNWSFLELGKWMGGGVYLAWGGLVIALPVLSHPESSQPILAAMLQFPLEDFPGTLGRAVLWGLAVANAGVLVALVWSKKLAARQAGVECIHLVLLAVMFDVTPMLLGFALYFAAWHSLTSMSDQQGFFRSRVPGYRWKDQILAALPYTMAAMVGLAGLWWVQHSRAWEVSWGAVFLFISLITLPHMLLIERMLEQGQRLSDDRPPVGAEPS